MTTADSTEPVWGRVLIAGGLDWATNGTKGRRQDDLDLSQPHILRSLSHVKVTKLLAGCGANYVGAIDINGVAHFIGKMPAYGPSANKGIVSYDTPVHISTKSVGLPAGTTWVGGGLGRAGIFLIDSKGDVWAAGNNVVGQLGLPLSPDVPRLTKVKGPWARSAKIIQVATGNTFTLFLTDAGQVYAAGSSEHGQLGNGSTSERIVKGNKLAWDVQTPPRQVQAALEDKKIVQIAAGSQHSLALDDYGNVYAWGYAGYARLGLGDQKDQLVPTLVAQFSDNNERKRAREIYCGPTSSVVIDNQGMFNIAGKWKITGDGSSGSPYTTFKQLDELGGCKVTKTAVGGCTHFITTPLFGGKTQSIGWGQGALYGELGFGPNIGKSSTKPQAIQPLEGIDVVDIAGGLFCTLFLARPNDALSELDRFPVQVESATDCLVCHKDLPDDPLLECERCDEPYHPGCLDPPLADIPEGQWFCPKCEKEGNELGLNDEYFDEEEDAPYEEVPVVKRRAESETQNGGKKPRSE